MDSSIVQELRRAALQFHVTSKGLTSSRPPLKNENHHDGWGSIHIVANAIERAAAGDRSLLGVVITHERDAHLAQVRALEALAS